MDKYVIIFIQFTIFSLNHLTHFKLMLSLLPNSFSSILLFRLLTDFTNHSFFHSSSTFSDSILHFKLSSNSFLHLSLTNIIFDVKSNLFFHFQLFLHTYFLRGIRMPYVLTYHFTSALFVMKMTLVHFGW